ncbi:16016_t:CDS:1, partial [Cetraspora pellucida]
KKNKPKSKQAVHQDEDGDGYDDETGEDLSGVWDPNPKTLTIGHKHVLVEWDVHNINVTYECRNVDMNTVDGNHIRCKILTFSNTH